MVEIRSGLSAIQPEQHAPAHPLDWRRRMSDNIAYALLVYTALQIFVTMEALRGQSQSLLPYLALIVLVAAIIPACRRFERRWERLDDDAAAGNHGAVVAADGVEVDVTILVDVGDDESELVHMAGEHEYRVAGRIERGDAVAQRVHFVGVGGGLDVAVKDGLGLGLVAGRRAGVE